MRSSANLLLLAALAACAGEGSRPATARPAYGDDGPQPPETPSASSAVDSVPLRPPPETAGAATYDGIGRVSVLPDGAAIAARHATLPGGSAAEVTALDSGRTILVRIDGAPDAPAGEIVLTPAAAALLGVVGRARVRVRAAVASPGDATALAAGRAASPRMDAPPTLLAALRKRVGNAPAAIPSRPVVATSRKASVPRAAAVVPAKPKPARAAPVATGRYRVQVAAVSNEARARQIAGTLGGSVEPAGALWRVRLGPFANPDAARRARDGAARRGYAGAQILD